MVACLFPYQSTGDVPSSLCTDVSSVWLSALPYSSDAITGGMMKATCERCMLVMRDLQEGKIQGIQYKREPKGLVSIWR